MIVKRIIPKSLLGRSIIIIFVPIIILVIITSIIFYQTSWNIISKRLTQSVVADINVLVKLIEKDLEFEAIQIAREDFKMKIKIIENGEIENKGFEISINSLNIDKPDFTWSTALTISANKNEVLTLGGEDFINLSSPGQATGPSVRIIPGQPIPAFLGATYLGTYKTPAEIDADGVVGSVLGGPRYIDENGDGA